MEQDGNLYWTLIDIANGLLSGAMLGGYYATLSIGLALAFGVMRLVNLAHGDLLILSSYLAVVVLQIVPAPPFASLIVVMPVMFGIGYLLQRLLLNRVSVQTMVQKGMSANFGLMSPILVTFGFGIFISNGLLAVFSPDAAMIKNDLAFSAIRLSQDLSISSLRFIFFVFAVVILAVLHLYLKFTHAGRAIRVASDDPEIAALMGIRTAHIYGLAMGLALGIAGGGGVMIGMLRTFQPFDGGQFLLVAFGIVIIGGLGSILGSLAGGILLGITQVLAGAYFGPSAQLVAGYMLILLVLAFRPQGLFPR
jgi:branched-chain amino acid transport system permease protein